LFDIKLTGLDELIAQFDRLERDWRADVAEGLGRAARTVADETARDTPVRTGRAKAGLQGMGGEVTSTGAEARIVSTGTPSAYFVASEREILEHDAEEEVVRETVDAMNRALARAFK
jgi:hypothetical protein